MSVYILKQLRNKKMKLADETKKMFNAHIKTLEKEIEPYFKIEDEQSYLLVSFIFREIQDFMHVYLQEHPNTYILEENDDISRELDEDDNDIEAYLFMYSAKNILPIYLETLSALSSTYNYDKYAKYPAHKYGEMSLVQIRKEKQNLIEKLIK